MTTVFTKRGESVAPVMRGDGGQVGARAESLPAPDVADGSTGSIRGVKWEELPDILTPADLRGILRVCSSQTLKRWSELGILPVPVIKSGNVVRWRKVDVMETLERRAKLGRLS
jgi:hypothetical protein